jgi:subtilase family serine protease
MRRGIAAGTMTLTLIFAVGGSAAIAAPGSAGEYAPVCSHALPGGQAGCDAIQLLNPAANWHGIHANGKGPSPTASTPSGYFPADLQSAYGLIAASGSVGSGQTVAIVDAYNDPYAETDLAVYRKHFELPACGAGCFTKVNQTGGTKYPRGNSGWAQEISLDLDMVSAICPNCHILLVEASSNSFENLGIAATYGAKNANAVSNSYGGSESSAETSYDHYYNPEHAAVTVSAGDNGYGVEYPAASPFVTAVGGTTLTRVSNTGGFTEKVWSGTGSGCSKYESIPTWQPNTLLCTKRTVADASADADPNTGVAVYDSYGEPGWLVFGGTSVSSPIVASVYALAGNASSFSGNSAQALYTTSPSPLNKITVGANGTCGTYLCNAADSLVSGYNGPTGLGTPNGTAGF